MFNYVTISEGKCMHYFPI